MKKKLYLVMAVLLLTGCAADVKSSVNGTEVLSQSSGSGSGQSEEKLTPHPERYTNKQKIFLEHCFGEEWIENTPDEMADNWLVGSGVESGHKTTGIAMGYSYEGTKADIPEKAGNKLLTPEVIETWEHEGKDFRLDEIAPYQYSINWGEEFTGHVHSIDWDIKEDEWHPEGFRIVLPVDGCVHPCEMKIAGEVSDDRILMIDMSVLFQKENEYYGGSIRHYMNYICSVFGDENNDLEQVSASVMAGSADKEGCYLVFVNYTEKDYTVPEEAVVDGTVPVKILKVNGESAEGYREHLSAGVPRMDCYAEWSSLEPGEHELAVELQAEDGSKKQVTIPFVY